MNIKFNAKFDPFTYDEMVKPLIYYKDAYDRASEAYSKMIEDSGQWQDAVDPNLSPEAYQMYSNFSNDLDNAVASFSRGMNSQNSRALLGLKRRYSQDIKPIENAKTEMDKANALRDANPDSIFKVSRYNSLDSFLNGKTADNSSLSKNAIMKETAAITQAVMSEALQDPELRKVLGGKYEEFIQHSGGSLEDFKEAIKLGMLNDPIIGNKFSEIRQKVAKKYGIQDYDGVGQKAIMDSIDLGLMTGIDKPVASYTDTRKYMSGIGGRSRGTKSRSTSTENKGSDGNPTWTANNIIIEMWEGDKDGKSARQYGTATDMDASKPHGMKISWDKLQEDYEDTLGAKAVEHLEGSDPRQYEFYIWTPTKEEDGIKKVITNKKRLQIIRKQSPVKPGVTKPDNTSTEDYLNEETEEDMFKDGVYDED